MQKYIGKYFLQLAQRRWVSPSARLITAIKFLVVSRIMSYERIYF